MMEPATIPPYLADLQTSWVPARRVQAEGRVIGITPEGGRRLNSAMLHGDEDRERLHALAAAMRSLGMDPVFQSPAGSLADQRLADMGYHAEAPTSVYTLPTQFDPPRAAGTEAYTADAPLALMRRFWADNGTNTARQAAMLRAQNPVFVLIRAGMTPAGLAFLGGQGASRMMHAVIVAASLRRRGIGASLVAACAQAAREQNATRLTWLTEDDNTAAHAAFGRIGAARQPGYCYRRLP